MNCAGFTKNDKENILKAAFSNSDSKYSSEACSPRGTLLPYIKLACQAGDEDLETLSRLHIEEL